MSRAHALLLAALVGLGGALPRAVDAQDPARMQQQQMMRMQQQMQELTRVMERVSGVQERARQMEREMLQSMERLQQNQQFAQQNAVQLRNQERLRSMAQSMNDGAGEMHRAMEQFRQMLGDPGAAWGPGTEREMQQRQRHWEDLADQMEESLRIMDRLRDRLRESSPT